MSTMTTPDTTAGTGTELLRDEGLRAMLIRNGLETVRRFTWDKVTDAFKEAIKG